ncbi:MAG: thioredoxin domain-containing protein [Candidatus Micrarchaeota archaeon]
MSDDDVKILAGVVILAALIICVFVWLSNNGLAAQIAEIKNLELRNAEAIARLGAGGTGGTGGTPTASPESGLPTEVTRIANGVSCSGSGKPKVFFFTDPYCPACASSEQYVNAFVDEFAGAANITYEIVVTHSGSLIQDYGEDNVTLAHKYFLCVQDQGLDKIQAFKTEFYKNLKDDGSDYIPFTAAQLAGFAQKAGADASKIASCLAGAKARVDADVQDALRYGGGTYSTPTMVLDCTYTGHAGYAASAFCYAFPDTAPCAA